MDRIRDTDFNLFAPFDPRHADTPPPRSEKLSGIFYSRLPSRVNARISGYGWTRRTNGRLSSVKSLRFDVNARDEHR